MFEQQELRDLMGESKKEALRVQFDPSVKMEFHGAKLTSAGGLIVYRFKCSSSRGSSTCLNSVLYLISALCIASVFAFMDKINVASTLVSSSE